MSIMAVQSSNPLQELARTLFSNYDGNNDGLLSSDEFTTFLNRLVTTTAASTTTTTTGVTASAFTPITTTALTLTTGPRSSMEGFDFAKVANTNHLTMKYKFARVAWNYDLSSVTDQASAETVLKGMVPDLEKAGLSVLEVKGDSLKLEDDAGEFWVDVVRGACSGSPAFQWLDTRY